VRSSDGKRSPGRLSRQGPAVLRWWLFEAGKTSARATAPDHRCYTHADGLKRLSGRTPLAGAPNPSSCRRA